MELSASDRERLIEQYARGPARLRAALDALPGEALTWRPAPREWSAHEVVCHCADAETNGAARIRYLLAEADPLIVSYDQEAWAEALDYRAHPLDAALATVDAVRAHTAALLRRLPDAAWQRRGRFAGSGSYSADDWLATYAPHLDGHAEQIAAAGRAWRARGASA